MDTDDIKHVMMRLYLQASGISVKYAACISYTYCTQHYISVAHGASDSRSLQSGYVRLQRQKAIDTSAPKMLAEILSPLPGQQSVYHSDK